MSIEDLKSKIGDKIASKFKNNTSYGAKKTYDEIEDTYYPERDKNGDGSALIRFLPGLDSEGNPYCIERFQHGFKHNGEWFIEFCPGTLDMPCPVCEYSKEVIKTFGSWDSIPEDVKNFLRNIGRNKGYRSGFFANILVIKDPANPENEGKVHLFRFGKTIADMIHEAANPKDDGFGNIPEPIDVFDLKNGANFKFIIRRKDKRANYSKSSFEESSPCPDFDLDEQFPLMPMRSEKIFKPYDELKKRFDKIMPVKPHLISSNTNTSVPPMSGPKTEADPQNETKNNVSDGASFADQMNTEENTGSIEDNIAYFQNLAESTEI
jgi:hypothetical protein